MARDNPIHSITGMARWGGSIGSSIGVATGGIFSQDIMGITMGFFIALFCALSKATREPILWVCISIIMGMFSGVYVSHSYGSSQRV